MVKIIHEMRYDMRKFRLFIVMTGALVVSSASTANDDSIINKVKILLMGDSTTQGGKPVFERSIEQLIAGKEGMPPVEVVNVGFGGETAYSLLNSGRYHKQIKDIDKVDYIFFRYGINDWIKRQPFKENFPADVKKVIAHLREDFPGAQIILMTIIPFLKEEDSKLVNKYIAMIAAEEKLELFDIYPAYQEKMKECGEHSMTVRFFPLSEIPENYHELVSSYTKFYEWKDAEWVRVQSNELDPLFGDLPNWYKDKHPNSTGYIFIAHETAKYILPKLKNNHD